MSNLACTSCWRASSSRHFAGTVLFGEQEDVAIFAKLAVTRKESFSKEIISFSLYSGMDLLCRESLSPFQELLLPPPSPFSPIYHTHERPTVSLHADNDHWTLSSGLPVDALTAPPSEFTLPDPAIPSSIVSMLDLVQQTFQLEALSITLGSSDLSVSVSEHQAGGGRVEVFSADTDPEPTTPPIPDGDDDTDKENLPLYLTFEDIDTPSPVIAPLPTDTHERKNVERFNMFLLRSQTENWLIVGFTPNTAEYWQCHDNVQDKCMALLESVHRFRRGVINGYLCGRAIMVCREQMVPLYQQTDAKCEAFVLFRGSSRNLVMSYVDFAARLETCGSTDFTRLAWQDERKASRRRTNMKLRRSERLASVSAVPKRRSTPRKFCNLAPTRVYAPKSRRALEDEEEEEVRAHVPDIEPLGPED